MRAIALLLALTSGPAIVRADVLVAASEEKTEPEPPVVWSVVSGAVAAMIPLAVGGGLMAQSNSTQDRQRRTGLDLIVSGFALAPIVSHLVGREWKRAAIFGTVSLVLAGIAIGTVEWKDGDISLSSIEAKNVFGAAVTATIIVAAAGVIDSLMAGDRWRDRQKRRGKPLQRSAFFSPTIGSQQGGLVVGGIW